MVCVGGGVVSAESMARVASPDVYWWHVSVAREVDYLTDECGTPVYPVAGVAGNVGMPRGDVARYVEDLVSWGILAYAPAPADWPVPVPEGMRFVGRAS